ncbi:MAG: ATP-binding protein [Peptostreptococcaceae bacterium]
MLHFEGLRRRIIKYYLTVIIITIALFEGLFIFSIQNYYYNSISQTLVSHAKSTRRSYSEISNESSSFDNKIQSVIDMEIKNDSKFAVQIIDKNKVVLLDQYGVRTNEKVEYEDVNRALADNQSLSPYTYRITNTKEHLMSISIPLKVNNIIEGVVRYTISLNDIDQTVFKLALGLVLAGIFILLITLSISLRFSESLIQPLRELKEFANELAHGNYNIKFKNKKFRKDEIGDLAQTFEHMAGEIDKTRRLKEEFISSISHELRTPLTSIKGWSETLGYENITRDELDLGLGIIQDETERLIKLVEELLDFSRLSSDRIRLQVDIVNVEALVKGVVNQLKVKAIENNINLIYNFKVEDLASIQGDKNRLRQVLINLIQNAIKFTPNDGKIEVLVSQDDEYTTITVNDTGSGIKEENLEKVLDKFFQEDFHKSGSGLGLAISNEIVKLHGGKVVINSKLGEGTSITFTLKNKIIESI